MVNLSLSMKVDFNKQKVAQDLGSELKKVLLEIMLAVERHSKRLAPVKTGRLRASIHTEPTRPANRIVVSDGVEYGAFQEFGTSKMKAKPFMRPAKDITLKADLPKIMERHGLR